MLALYNLAICKCSSFFIWSTCIVCSIRYPPKLGESKTTNIKSKYKLIFIKILPPNQYSMYLTSKKQILNDLFSLVRINAKPKLTSQHLVAFNILHRTITVLHFNHSSFGREPTSAISTLCKFPSELREEIFVSVMLIACNKNANNFQLSYLHANSISTLQ